jgi:outer membrane protein OmpA-like peptidoglycan-associated protein
MTLFPVLMVTLMAAQSGGDCADVSSLLASARRESEDRPGLERRLAMMRRAVARCSSSAELLNDLGDTLERLQRYDEALVQYRAAIELRGDWALPYFGMGDVYRRTGRKDEALFWYESGLALQPGEPETLDHVRQLRANDPPGLMSWRSIAPILDATRGPGVLQSLSLDEKRLPFDLDRATLRTDALTQIREIAFALRDRFSHSRGMGVLSSAGPVVLEVAGHADRQGSDTYNYDLARRRAEAVVDELVTRFAIPRARLRAVSYGRSRPLCTDDTSECHARNRRVEIRRPAP